MVIRVRGTFIEDAEFAQPLHRRRSSMPPALDNHDLSGGEGKTEQWNDYVSALLERVEQLSKSASSDEGCASRGSLGEEDGSASQQQTSSGTSKTASTDCGDTCSDRCSQDEAEAALDISQSASQQEAAEEDAEQVVTTIMLSNIPCRLIEGHVAEVLDASNLTGRYDFLFVPRSYRPESNLGYAFVNFISSEDARRAMRLIDGHRFKEGSTKACVVKPARIQGAKENMERFQSARHRRRKEAWFVNTDAAQQKA